MYPNESYLNGSSKKAEKMEKKEIFEIVQLAICQQASLLKNEVEIDSTLDSLELDSLDKVDMSVDFESEFNIEIEGEEFDDLATVDEIVNLIYDKLQSKSRK